MSLARPLLMFVALIAMIGMCLGLTQANAQETAQRSAGEIVNAISGANLREIAELVSELAATGEPGVAGVLGALEAGELYADEANAIVVILRDGVMLSRAFASSTAMWAPHRLH